MILSLLPAFVHHKLEDFALIDGLSGLLAQAFSDAWDDSDFGLRQLLVELLLLHLAHHELGEGGLRLGLRRLVDALEPRLHRLSGRHVLPALVRRNQGRAITTLVNARIVRAHRVKLTARLSTVPTASFPGGLA